MIEVLPDVPLAPLLGAAFLALAAIIGLAVLIGRHR